MNVAGAKELVEQVWEQSAIPAIAEYIKIPNQSPLFDPLWATNGHQEAAIDLIVNWTKEQNVEGLQLEVVRAEARTPLILITLDATPGCEETILLYGHLDKQPPMKEAWSEGLGPWTPVLRDGKLYGRGSADDGYAVFSAVTAFKVLQTQNIPHARCVLLIEACEESGSKDLPFYINHKAEHIGSPSLVICLDSGCGDYNHMWLTTSLRGMMLAEVRVRIIDEAVHSGSASGIVPSTFRIMRELLDRVEDCKTGEILIREAHCDISEKTYQYAREMAETLGEPLSAHYAFVPGAQPVTLDPVEQALNATWKPTLCYTGASGLPDIKDAGNVLRTETALKLSFRLPPPVQPADFEEALARVILKDPPYNAQIVFNVEKGAAGWCMPPLKPWLEKSLMDASLAAFGKPVRLQGEGGSIPFMGMLGRKFPQTQFVITGVLGPGSNAHGPNEFLHIAAAKNITLCVALLIQDHFKSPKE
jgi:acetylornithine deacetylase/succinyl-diaminopimelate desuccinylase-like protein